jgi:ribonuclease P protein component
LLAHLKTAEQFAAVLDASRRKAPEAQKQSGIWRSAHFALHFSQTVTLGLPTEQSESVAQLSKPAPPLTQAVIGVICPKRWAKRAVTRNTIKRQVYAVSSELRDQLPAGYVVVRLATTWSREQFKSATSPALKLAVRQELLALFSKLSQVSG